MSSPNSDDDCNVGDDNRGDGCLYDSDRCDDDGIGDDDDDYEHFANEKMAIWTRTDYYGMDGDVILRVVMLYCYIPVLL